MVAVVNVGVSPTVVWSVWLVTGADGPLLIRVIPALLAELDEGNTVVSGVLEARGLVGFPVPEGLTVPLLGEVCCVLTNCASVLWRVEEERLRVLWAEGVLVTRSV